jgi:hypothetical protein
MARLPTLVDATAAFAVAACILMPVRAPAQSAGPTPAVTELASHRAIYDLKLDRSRGKRSIESVRGRILYDFSGSICEGYALQFRQVSEIDSGEGKVVLSDLRATTWEDGEAKSFRFNSQNRVNDRTTEAVDGNALRGDAAISVKLTKPKPQTLGLDINIAFPTEHIRRIIQAAEAGKSLLELAVYDGTETGEKIFSTLTVIGHEIGPDGKKPDDVAADSAALGKLKRWPVTISYFEQKAATSTGDQTPVYSIGFELYENGVSRALMLDYGDFVVSGQLSKLDMKDAPACK